MLRLFLKELSLRILYPEEVFLHLAVWMGFFPDNGTTPSPAPRVPQPLTATSGFVGGARAASLSCDGAPRLPVLSCFRRLAR